MPRTSTIATHPEREKIEADLLAGTSFRIISQRFGISTAALQRHRVTLVEVFKKEDETHSARLREKIEALEGRAAALGKKAEEGGDLKTALAGLREQARLLELSFRVVDSEQLMKRIEQLENTIRKGGSST